MAYLHFTVVISMLIYCSHSQEITLNFTDGIDPLCELINSINSFPPGEGPPGGLPTSDGLPGGGLPGGLPTSDGVPVGGPIDNNPGEGSPDENSTGSQNGIFPETDVQTLECTETAQKVCKRCNISQINCTREQNEFLYTMVDTLKNHCSIIIEGYLQCNTSKTVDQTKAIFNIVFGIIGFVGNFLVVLVTVVFRKISSRCHFLIAGLSLVDFIFSAFQIVLHIPQLWTCEWLYGLGMCKFLHSTLNLSYMLALGFILLIATERYVGIVHTFSKWLTNRVLWLLIGVNIIMGIGTTTPSAVFLKLKQYEGDKIACEEKWPSETSSLVYSYFLFIFYFLIPVGIIIYLYVKIIVALRTGSKNMHMPDEKQYRKRLNDNKRIMKILISILVAFVVFVLPNRITWILIDHIGKDKLISKDGNTRKRDALTLFGFIPYACHTAINPIIYSLIDTKFQKKVKSIFKVNVSVHRGKSGITESSSTNSANSSIELKKYSVAR